MKRLHFIIIVVILMVGCASRSDKSIGAPTNPISKINDTLSEKYAVVSDFLDTKIKDRSKKIMIMSQQINTNMTLRILRLNEIYALDSIDSKKIMKIKHSLKRLIGRKHGKNTAKTL